MGSQEGGKNKPPNRESLLLAAGRHHQTLKGQPCKAPRELPARARRGEQQLPLPAARARQSPLHEKEACSSPQTHPTGPHLPLYSSPFSVSELRWEFDWYLKHPLRQAQTPPPSQHHSKLCPYFRSPLSPERLQRVSTQQSPPSYTQRCSREMVAQCERIRLSIQEIWF